jgi:hypothetical protein
MDLTNVCILFCFHHHQAARSFRPDFVLIRQPPRDGAKDFRSTLLGLKFGGVPSINSLNSIYQFQVSVAGHIDKPHDSLSCCVKSFVCIHSVNIEFHRQSNHVIVQELIKVWLLLGSLGAESFHAS